MIMLYAMKIRNSAGLDVDQLHVTWWYSDRLARLLFRQILAI